jgi:mannose-6-phosphate isomerase-like protein (cupin superfamily)
MEPWIGDIEKKTLDNETFRTVLFTGHHEQLTVMSLRPGEDIGYEVHAHNDQFLRIERGRARVDLGPKQNEVEGSVEVKAGSALLVPAGVWHNVVNVGDEDVKLYSLYAPPVHLDGTVHRTKAEADAAEVFEREALT